MNDKCLNKTFPKVNNTSTITILVILSILIGLGQRGSIEFLQKFKNTYEITYIYKLVALISLVVIVRYFFYLYIDNINTKNANQIMETALKKWFNLDLYQQQAEAPTFSHNLSQTISRSNAIIRSIFRNILVDTVIFLLFFASMLYQYFSYFLIVWFFLNIIAARYIIPKVNKIYKEYTIAHKKYNHTFYDIVLNSWNVKFQVIETEIRKEIYQLSEQQLNLEKKLRSSILFYERIVTNVIFGSLLIYLIYLFITTENKDSMTAFWLIVFQIYSKYFSVWEHLFRLSNLANQSAAMCHFWDINPEIFDTPGISLDNFKQLEFRNVSFEYNNLSVLKDSNLKISSGETIAIIGESGSGKSTSTNLIFKLIKPTKGEVLVNDKPIDSYSLCSLRKKIGIVPQNIRLFEEKTVRENIIIGLDIDPKKLTEVLELVYMDDIYLDKKGSELSLGQKQRIVLARVLYTAAETEIFIFDEYLSAVDPKISEAIHLMILNMIKQENKVGLFISHDHSIAKQCERVILLQDKQFIEITN